MRIEHSKSDIRQLAVAVAFTIAAQAVLPMAALPQIPPSQDLESKTAAGAAAKSVPDHKKSDAITFKDSESCLYSYDAMGFIPDSGLGMGAGLLTYFASMCSAYPAPPDPNVRKPSSKTGQNLRVK